MMYANPPEEGATVALPLYYWRRRNRALTRVHEEEILQVLSCSHNMAKVILKNLPNE